MQQFKIRASGCSNIMGIKGLGKTGESYIKTWLKEIIYDRKKEFTSKYTDKGNIMEDNSIDFIADQLGYGMLIKNEEHFENKYMTGTPDIILKDHIIDVKNSWDFGTFPLFDEELNPAYYWQAQVYMELTGIKEYKVIYTLMDTPINLIEKKAYWYAKNQGYEELDESILNKFIEKMTYPDIDPKYRIKVFNVKYNKQDVEKIIERVKVSRKLIESLTKNI